MTDGAEFSLEFEVRDYECDIQGIVNNAVYQNYLEHTRHQYIRGLGLDFAKLNDEGIQPVVYKSELTYKQALRSGDKFVCTLNRKAQGKFKVLFHQDIYRLPDKKLILKGVITVAVKQNGKLVSADCIF